MSRLVESINICNGKPYHLGLHEARANASRRLLYGTDLPDLKLAESIIVPSLYTAGLVKCRVIYDRTITSIDFSHYTVRSILSLSVIHDDTINYPLKWVERPQLDELYAQRQGADEILIFKNGLLTDAYYYNVVIAVNGKYLTPRLPLLKGVRRAQLLVMEWIEEADIDLKLLRQATSIYLVNAMTVLGKIKLAPYQIIY